MEIATVDRLDMKLDGRRINIASRKARALLGYLVLNETHSESREQLVGLFWSESEEEKARGSLRQSLKEIRLAFRGTSFTGLQLDTQTISFEPASLTVDIWEIFDRAKSGEVHRKLLETPQLTDLLLKDVEAVDPVFRTWLLAKRQSLNQRLIRHLEDALEATGSATRSSEDVARAILNLDPTHEVACRHLMRARSKHGDIGGALKIYSSLWELLDSEYDVEPTEETQSLFAELKAALPLAGRPPDIGQSAGPVGPVASRREGRTKLVLSIASFDATAISPERRYLVQGFRSELIAYLARFREWLVRDQPSAGDRMAEGDEYVLRADAMPFKDGARLTLSLRECATNEYLWGDGLNLENVDWGEAQQSVVRRIAAALNIHVSAGRLAQIGVGSTTDMLAYDMWLRGQSHYLLFEPVGLVRANELFRETIKRHPNFAPAYSSLAQMQNSVHFIYPGRFRSTQVTAEALHFASEAVRLDPMDSRSQLCLGWANAMSGLHDQAAVHHMLAAELNESDPWTLVSAALGFAFRGDRKLARELDARAASLALAPSGTQCRYHTMVRYLIEDFESALVMAAQAERSIQNVFVWKAASLVSLGRVDEAKAAAEFFFKAVTERWFGPDKPPTRRAMAHWFLHAFPLKNAELWARLHKDFAQAGAPVEGIEFNIW